MIGGLVVLLGVISMVLIHEGGHFLAAKAVGMKATEFFFGFGPKLWSTQRGETEYGVKAIPLGGYVRIVGMNPYEEIELDDEGRTYRERPFWQKTIVVLAGVASHFVVAFLIFFVVVTMIGINVTTEVTTEIAAVQEVRDDGSRTPASLAGILEGDRIVSIAGAAVFDWDGVVAEIGSRPGESVVIVVDRASTAVELEATLAVRMVDGDERGFLGVVPVQETAKERVNPIVGLGRSATAVGDATVASVQGMWQLLSGFGDLVTAAVTGDDENLDEVRPASPIGLVRLGAETERFGIGFTLELVALVNIFVGLFNVIPIYPLDGGHFSVALYEKIKGRPADVRKLAPVAAVVVIFMVLLGVLAIYLDITNPFTIR